MDETAVHSEFTQAPVACFPATSTWAGNYDFKISFSSDEQLIKKVEHTYSPVLKKLFVRKDASCPVSFSTSYDMAVGTVVRAMVVFSLPDHASEVVNQCINHAVPDITMGIQPHLYHLVRSESCHAMYEQDPMTGRRSVVVPYENPHAGESCSTYIYKFVCWGSCAGGLNRRPVTLVFTLENGGIVLGRQSVDLRICACPGRDRRAEETHFERKHKVLGSENQATPKTPNLQEGNILDIMKFAEDVKFPPPKKLKIAPHTPDGKYIIMASNPAMYNFLKQMETFYHACNYIKKIPPQLQRAALSSHLQSIKHNRNSRISEESDYKTE